MYLFEGVAGEVNDGEPLEAQCRPYVEQALKKLETGDTPTGNRFRMIFFR